MKILGVGIDMVKNSRMRYYVGEKYAIRFIKKFLHPVEI